MSVIKSINSKSNSKAALSATLKYVFQEKKTNQSLCYVTGDFLSKTVTPQTILKEFMETKETWDKTGGRMYKHFVISWHKDENIHNKQALSIIREWCEKVFPGFQCAIAIHTDRDYVHGHIVVNSVNFLDGHKYHMNPKELAHAKTLCDEIDKRYGFVITQKGKHYDGSKLEAGTIRAFQKAKYYLLQKNDKPSKLEFILRSIIDVTKRALTKEEFISMMREEHHIETIWKENRKYITFENTENHFKVRDKNLSTTFSMPIHAKALLRRIEKNLQEAATLTEEERTLARGVAEKLIECKKSIVYHLYRIHHDIIPYLDKDSFFAKQEAEEWKYILRYVKNYDDVLSATEPKIVAAAKEMLTESYNEERAIELHKKRQAPHAPSEDEILHYFELAEAECDSYLSAPTKAIQELITKHALELPNTTSKGRHRAK